jgi:hypothetical protein
MDAYGNFTVGDDPEGAIAVGLLIATSTVNEPKALSSLAPDGGGLYVQGVGSIDRVTAREELPVPFDEDPTIDPNKQEIWYLFREPDHMYRSVGRALLSGDELRDLVKRAIALRAAQANG